MHKILVIEDNPYIRENLEELLEISDYKPVLAENGAIGIDKVFSENPDLIICDISMPLKNGYEVFEAVQSYIKEHSIPFIFLTASAQERDIAEGKASGADAYMTKPFEAEVLLEVISNLIKKSQLE